MHQRNITHGPRKGNKQFLKVKNSFWVYGFEIYKKLKNGVMGRQVSEYPTPPVVLEGGVAFYELPADLPPSTMYTPPVQKLLSSLARNSINFATSSGSPYRWRGMRAS